MEKTLAMRALVLKLNIGDESLNDLGKDESMDHKFPT